ncbi:MAG: EAL domain-containing protein [Acidimicrobiales bacterium]
MHDSTRRSPEPPRAIQADHDAIRRGRVWPAVAVLIAVIGSVSAVFGARAVATADSEDSRDAFDASSTEIAATLAAAVEDEADLAVNAAAYIVGNPDTTNDEFVAWTENIRLIDRYPQLRSILFATMVPADELDGFLRDVTAPLSPTATGAPQVVPGGERDLYCLTVAKKATGTALPAGMDFCATALGRELLAARDSGLSSYVAVTDETFTSAAREDAGDNTSADPQVIEDVALLLVQTPVYRSGTVPDSPEARRAEFLGWIGMAVSPEVVLHSALVGRDEIGLRFTYDTGASRVAFSNKTMPVGSQVRSFDFGNGWTAETFGAVEGSGVFTSRVALTVLTGGIVLSFAVALLVLVLSTGRARAWRFVREMTDELRHQAMHDPLTGLPNRSLIADRTEQLLARNRRSHTAGAALFIDLDEFKNINDTLGHEAGDELLESVARRLTHELREADTIGRLGGDEFIVLLDDASVGTAERVAQRLLDVMREPFTLAASNQPIVVSASIGVALGDRESPSELLRDADVALYRAKAAGRNCHATFSSEMEAHIQQRLELEFDLRSALDGDQFRLVYQPMYDLSDLSMIGVEALLRWDHPTQGLINPDGFIPMLESSGKITDVGRWVLAEACARAEGWRSRGSAVGISVNVSGRQLVHDSVVDDVRAALDSSGLEPAALTIEITESVLMRDVETTARRLRDLKSFGVGIAIDDFGTGYSSLAYLQKFPVDRLKIDRSFTDAMTRSSETVALIHTLVQVGKSLGLRTLAEGVETAEQIDRLRAEGVDEVQGYLLARPLDAARLEEQLLRPLRPDERSQDLS